MSEKKREPQQTPGLEALDHRWVPQKPMGLARALAKAGYATRAKAEQIVRSGRIKVDGRVDTDPATTVGPESVIFIDDQPLVDVPRRYFVFHKPTRVISTPSDHGGRRLVSDFLPHDIPGLCVAGRLDAHTSGLMLVSNDSVWNCYAAAGAHLEKEYKIKVTGHVTDVEIGIVLAGMHLPSLGFIRPQTVEIQEAGEKFTVLRLVVTEGKNRQVRRIFNALRHDVVMLCRTRIGPVRLGNLLVGKLRELTREEVDGFRQIASQDG